MIIEKTAICEDNYRINEYYYESAREGMFDLLSNMVKAGMINTILLPGYIGWSPKEGSGIFDPINKLTGLSVHYYKVTSALEIDMVDLANRISGLIQGKFAVLIVNYFGFVNSNINDINHLIKSNGGWIVEDNAHGFFTYQYRTVDYCDATFFSLHKMFPFQHGGSLIIKNSQLRQLSFSGDSVQASDFIPWNYDIRSISNKRRENYKIIEEVIAREDSEGYFAPLKKTLGDNVPQTFPIYIYKGNRDKIYELMNEAGYGVVSLYHTLIEPLRTPEYQISYDVSRHIMNLPVHQDVDSNKYPDMIRHLIQFCKLTSN